jgi:hypothetical protein
MTVPYVPSASNFSPLGTYKEYSLAWMRSNPGTLCKIGGKQVILRRRLQCTDETGHTSEHYNNEKS